MAPAPPRADTAAHADAPDILPPPAKPPAGAATNILGMGARRTFSQTCKVDVFCEHPHFLNPLLAACQLVNVSKPGEEPEDVTATQEDCRLLHPALVNADGSPWAADKRRKWCDAPENVGDLYFEPGLVYTFCWWQHFFDLANYKVHAGPMAVDLCPFMCAQPIGVFIKDLGRDEAALSLLIWHERLLFPEEAGKRKKKSKAVKGDDTAAEDDQGAAGGLSERFKGLLANWRA
ncbi:hypothetical protein Rsub_11055 [Raphidocelis subcapitata]|uniref:Domain of unknown function at the cortex 1 domain-containing protein n=1 Tax=Raphidocelis subcapitata TaxID=307507 RepID=A0A2V0PME4_9CHLO|nr:hypothetical protein Rsub_11055 [Raphidocelis subcapitata]|eukprot:GBF98235.1 hypothetical protein Rsub_11055 [Raphidocelis subcapitata]